MLRTPFLPEFRAGCFRFVPKSSDSNGDLIACFSINTKIFVFSRDSRISETENIFFVNMNSFEINTDNLHTFGLIDASIAQFTFIVFRKINEELWSRFFKQDSEKDIILFLNICASFRKKPGLLHFLRCKQIVACE